MLHSEQSLIGCHNHSESETQSYMICLGFHSLCLVALGLKLTFSGFLIP